MLRYLLILCCFVPTASAYAASALKENLYQVEVLVFENRLPEFEGNELWTRDTVNAKLEDLEKSQTPHTSAALDSQLSAFASLLDKDNHYRVLAHQRWNQVAEEKSNTKPVRILPRDPLRSRELDGLVRFYMSRFLHLDVNMLYEPDAAENTQREPASDSSMLYRISEQRRIKSQETHYFDHPKFGLLVRVTPIIDKVNTGK